MVTRLCSTREQGIDLQSLNKMAFSWDWLITLSILVTLVLAIWAKVSQQTITELLRDLRDLMQSKGEDNLEYVNEVRI